MNTSAANIILSEIESKCPSPGTRAYFQARLRARLYDLVMTKFRREVTERGLTKAVLGRRIGKRPEVVTRLLGGPGNWTLDTLSDLLLGISGEELDATASSPSARASRNYGYADFLGEMGEPVAGVGVEEQQSLLLEVASTKQPVMAPDSHFPSHGQFEEAQGSSVESYSTEILLSSGPNVSLSRYPSLYAQNSGAIVQWN